MITAYRLPERLPVAAGRLRISIAVPVRNETETIEATLAALAAQRTLAGEPFERAAFEIIVFANNCSDDTAAVARAFAERSDATIHVVEDALPPAEAHVGTARRAVMEAAAARVAGSGRASSGIVATTDGDSAVHAQWLAETERALRTADAVGGRIYVSPAGLRSLPEPLVRGLENEERYRFAVARAEAFCDPLPHDPWPRHGQQFAASLALRAETYLRAGGLPALPALEDLALYGELVRLDARFVHSLRVRVATSARLDSRASGGFGTHVARLQSIYRVGAAQGVEAPALTIARIRSRSLLRTWRRLGRSSITAGDVRLIATTFRTSERTIAAALGAHATFGATFVAMEREAGSAGVFDVPNVPVGHATAELERWARSLAR